MFATNRVTLFFLILTMLHHSAVGMHQLNVAKPHLANESFVMSVEPDATTAQEPSSVVEVAPQLEVPDRSNAANAHGHDAAQGTRHNMERPKVDLLQDESIREKEAGALLMATSAESREVRLRAGHRVRSTDTVLLVALCIIILALLMCIFVVPLFGWLRQKSDTREGTTRYQRNYQASPSPAAGLLTRGTFTSPFPSSATFQPTQSMSETPPSSSQMPVADMRLVLPTPLITPQSAEGGAGLRGGVDFRIDGVWTPWQGGNRAQIHNMAKQEEAACLHWSETDHGSGILFVLSPNSPIAWLDTKLLRSGELQEVSVFGAADEYWSAMAAPAAVVKPTRDGSGFVMVMGSQELIMIYLNEQKQLSSIVQDGKVVAQVQSGFGPGYLLRIVGGADAGLVLIATVCCLQMIDHPKKWRPGSSVMRPQ